MKTTALSIICVLTMAYTATAYELPEVIGVLEEEGIFASDFCWVGDQNNDGFDDLLIKYTAGNQALLYYGDEQIENEPGFIFEPYLQNQQICIYSNFAGEIIPNRASFIVLLPFIRSESPDTASTVMLNLYEGGENIDNEPDYTFTRQYQENGIQINEGYNSRPADFNGDGYHDLLTIYEGRPHPKLFIFHGGEDFDTIPDWEKGINGLYSYGHDVNEDGYSDIILRTHLYREEFNDYSYLYSLYLGGNPMDTIATLEFWEDHFEGRIEQRRMIHGFSLLPDVNDDGYDDWGIYWSEDEDDGFFIFFGGEEPDMEPDMELEGHRRLWRGDGGLTGGDFNGDGIGDIVTRLDAGNPEMSEIHIHFGSRWMDGDTDIFINLEREYNGQYFILPIGIGAAGDYNGDDVDDFVISGSGKAIIFAGNRDWERGIDSNNPPDTYKLSLRTSPNPFNSQVNISYTTIKTDLVRLAVYDIQGRLVDILEDRLVICGNHRVVWFNRTAGLYFICLQAGDSKIVKKVVCIP